MRRLIVMLMLFVIGFSAVAVPEAHAQTAAIPSTYATVINANFLNVRTAPTTTAGVIAVLSRGYSYPVLGKTADSGWWLLSMSPNSGITGWASGWYLNIPNQQLVPVLSAPAPTPATFSLGTVDTGSLNVRTVPSAYTGSILAVIAGGEVHRVVGRNNVGTRWWQIQLLDGRLGWVNGNYMNVSNEHLVPITDFGTDPNPIPSNAFGTVTAYFLNVRSTPNPYIPNILLKISRNQTYAVVGRNASGTWWQINVNGVIGWVNGKYFAVTNGHLVPITG